MKAIHQQYEYSGEVYESYEEALIAEVLDQARVYLQNYQLRNVAKAIADAFQLSLTDDALAALEEFECARE